MELSISINNMKQNPNIQTLRPFKDLKKFSTCFPELLEILNTTLGDPCQ